MILSVVAISLLYKTKMGQNSPKLLQKKQRRMLQQIISRTYKQKHDRMNISWCKQWDNVLLFKDWTSLVWLGLFECQIDQIGAQLFGKLPWPHLEYLDLGKNKINGLGIGKIFINQYPRLKHLILKQNQLGTVGAKLLNKAQLPHLQKLQISKCQLGQQAIKHLTKSHWPELISLQLRGNNINQKSCLALTTSNWKHLELVRLCYRPNKQPLIGLLYLTFTDWPSSQLNLDYNYRYVIIKDPHLSKHYQSIAYERFGCNDQILLRL